MVLVDSFGRPATDLRVSVTERCNFRCIYCHNEGQGPVRPVASDTGFEMAPEEIERVVRVAARLGIRRVKLSGGEPLVRRDLEDIVARCAIYAQEVSLVTNGALLAGQALDLKVAGLDRVNISVDSLEPSVFREVRGGPLLPVLEGLRAALLAGLTPVKLNMVVLSQTLPFVDEMVDYVVSATEPGSLVLNLIQFMPERVGQDHLSVDIQAVHERLARRSDRVEVREMHHRRVYHMGPAKVEVVDPHENPDFCAACQRLRLTADGNLKGCLNRDDDRVPVRGLNEAGIEAAFRRVVVERVPYYGGLLRRQSDGSWKPAAATA